METPNENKALEPADIDVRVDALVMQDAEVSFERMREKAEALWAILDDISSAGDIFKPGMSPFATYVLRRCEEKNIHFESDGYKLFVTA